MNELMCEISAKDCNAQGLRILLKVQYTLYLLSENLTRSVPGDARKYPHVCLNHLLFYSGKAKFDAKTHFASTCHSEIPNR